MVDSKKSRVRLWLEQNSELAQPDDKGKRIAVLVDDHTAERITHYALWKAEGVTH